MDDDKYDFFDSMPSPSIRKRPFPYSPPASNASGLDETDDTDSSVGHGAGSSSGWKHARQNHSQIEKRRRDKMNMYINELAALVPMCSAMSKKLDKLTVLRMVVQYVKTVRGAVHSYTEGTYKPSFVTDAELRNLILRISDGFVFVVGCDRGRLLFVSESVKSVLGYPRSELLGQSWFDMLHPKDIQKMKEQLAASDLSPRERYIDSKTMLPVKTGLGAGHANQATGGLCPGARRAFFCRMRAKDVDNKQSRQQKRFTLIRCVGYLKAWTPLDDEEGGGGNLSCLVAVGRAMPPRSSYSPPPVPILPAVSSNLPPQTGLSFCSRHSLDGKFVYVDPNVTFVLGYLPQEVIGLNLSDFYHPEDAAAMGDALRSAISDPGGVLSTNYRFKAKDGTHPVLQTHFKAFRNPWTKDTEFVVARNFIPVRPGVTTPLKPDVPQPCVEILPTTSTMMPPSLPSCSAVSTLPQCLLTPSPDVALVPPTFGSFVVNHHPQLDVSSDCCASSIVSDGGAGSTVSAGTVTAVDLDAIGVDVDADVSDGNDEAAMAVIMRLLEVDAGLGGPVDYSGLPWPLT